MKPQRPPRPTTHLTVLDRQWLTPHMVRLTAGGPNFDAFRDAGFADSYVKIVFDHEGRPYDEPVDVAALRASTPNETWPKTRTYTVRSVDRQARTISIDFVIHGDSGIAGPWAATVEPGSLIQFMGPGGAWSPADDADFHLFVGDESAIPAIAASLERLPGDAVGAVILEAAEHALDVSAPAGVTVEWIVRGGAEYDPTVLAERVGRLDLPEGDVSVFAHGEREAMKHLRRLFRDIPRERLSISGYWAYGREEDVFQAEKRTEIGKI
ncbi:siderophore-interacting protein [Flaviflexus equikiangi]|uniref:siderophore-interacting protein n=1 Tax=Flaviflexus equikiangi TaxID=2758573 RepID=UPI0015F6C94F|nr:siderophore-interacting protein [Flaviflexus equikiangi]